MLVRIPNVGKTGLVKDYALSSEPIEVLGTANNVRCRNAKLELIYGENELSSAAGSSVVFSPRFILYHGSSTVGYWLLLGTDRAYASSLGTGVWTEVTNISGDYTGTEVNVWAGDVLSGIVAVTNGVDIPQVWTEADSGTQLIDLPNWDATDLCEVIRSHKNYLIALGITKSSVAKPHMVKWSDSAEPGTSPEWDEANATLDAGESDLPGADHVVDGGTLQDFFVVYKERSTHIMQYVGGQYIFKFTQSFTDSGILGKNCWVEMNGQHVVLTDSDLIIHNGVEKKSLLDGRVRSWLFDSMSASFGKRSFLVKQVYYNEVWVCFPESGSEVCTKALVWNWAENTLTTRNLSGVTHGAAGPTAVPDAVTYETTTDTYASASSSYSAEDLTPSLQNVVLANPTTDQLTLMDSTNLILGAPILGTIERLGLDFGQPDKRKFIRGIRPRFSGDAAEIKIRVGGHEDLYGPITWGPIRTLTVGTDFKTDHLVSGRFIALNITSESPRWALESLDIDVEILGEY